jgi:hypothetical protein
MTQQQHPITPPPELVEDWIEIAKPEPWKCPPDPNVLCTLAAQWGADQELEACCEWFKQEGWNPCHPEALLAARRPKPPSLKEQALEALKHAPGPDYPNPITLLTADEHALIRRALEQLDD